ncbi:DUF4185 domain-containing protein [Streptomyces boninensis]|uniref:DUF4185 domain-containing protein n=1 Tax=Streptomyces boninensis TaxID=2039455 RepID=UPI003B2199E0
MREVGETRRLSELGLVSRRTILKAGAGAAAGTGLAMTGGSHPAHAAIGNPVKAKANAIQLGQLTGPSQTGDLSVPYTDLAIPVQLSDGSLLLIGGDTYAGGLPGDSSADWRSPVALRSHSALSAGESIVVDGAVADRPGHAKGLVPEGHDPVGPPPETPPDRRPQTTALPSDIFRVGDTLYMHLMRGVIYDTHHTDFWKSTDNGETWTYLRQWPGNAFLANKDDNASGQFQQKTYAADTDPSDPYIYVMSTVFNRDKDSGLLLFRVLKSDLDKTDADAADSGWGWRYAYQGWGHKDGQWGWGNEPTSITDPRKWGEICFRAMEGKYALSWFQPTPVQSFAYADIRAMTFPLPTSDLFRTPEQTMLYFNPKNPASESSTKELTHVFPNLYGGFIFPGSTFDNFHIAVSRWNPSGRYPTEKITFDIGDHPVEAEYPNYAVTQWRASLYS